METKKDNVPASFTEGVTYGDNKPSVTLVLETSTTKEIRICLANGQTMAEHQSPFPIVIHILTGEIILGVQSEQHRMKAGQLIGLEGSVLHDLTAVQDTIVRLSIHKNDHLHRVQNVINNN